MLCKNRDQCYSKAIETSNTITILRQFYHSVAWSRFHWSVLWTRRQKEIQIK